MELSVDTLNIASASDKWADCQESLQQWNEAYRRVETYFLALHVDNKLMLSSLVLKILGKASDRHEQNPERSPVELASEEADRLLVGWFRNALGNEDQEPIDRLSARGRLALLLIEADTPWQQMFLQDEPIPPHVSEKMRQAYLEANPEFSFSEMRPRPIDLGIVEKAGRTFGKVTSLKTTAQWLLWLIFGLGIATVFILTR